MFAAMHGQQSLERTVYGPVMGRVCVRECSSCPLFTCIFGGLFMPRYCLQPCSQPNQMMPVGLSLFSSVFFNNALRPMNCVPTERV